MESVDYIFITPPSRHIKMLCCPAGHQLSSWQTPDLHGKKATYVLENDRIYLLTGAGINLNRQAVERPLTLHMRARCEECGIAVGEALGQQIRVVGRFEKGICTSVLAMMPSRLDIA